MWAQLITARLKPGREGDLQKLVDQLRALEQPGSGLVRSTAMQDQNDPGQARMLVVFESEAKARERESDPRRQEGMRDARAFMAEIFEGPPEFVDLTFVDEVEMRPQSVAFVSPLLPGKMEVDRAALESVQSGARKQDHADSRRRAGVTREACWMQSTPGGDFAVVYVEAGDIGAAFGTLGTSPEPFDVWFRDHIREVHGMSLEDGFPPPDQVLDFTA